MAQKLQQQLREVGSKLENPSASKDALVKLLKQAASFLSELDQSPSSSMLESMQPCLNTLVKPELLKHQDRDVKLLVATCICEIIRISAPEAPYSDDVLRDIFHLIVGTFSGLGDINGPSFGRRVVILETLARYRSCVVMLDLECDDLVNEMFSTFFAVASDDHPENVLTSMQTIMVLLIEESEDVQENVLLIVLSVLGRGRSDVSMAARRLAMNVIEHCAGKLEPGIKQFLISSMSGDKSSLNSQLDYHEVIYDLYRCAPQILSGIIPYITGELLTDQSNTRLKAVRLLGDLFALPDYAICEAFHPIFSEFLKRLTDRVVEVRMSVIGHVRSCLLSNPFRDEAPQIIDALCDRLLDYDENVRKEVVAALCDVACHTLKSIPIETIKLVAERLRDKSLLVKRYTMERLAEIYRICCLKSSGSVSSDDFDWIPGKILRCFFDKDFRSETIEVVLCESLFPTEFSIKDKVKHWVKIFPGFDKVEVKALEKILEQRQRLQQEMLKYISFRQMHQDNNAPELLKKIFVCCRIMSHCFPDPSKAEESFQILDQLKDANIWKILSNLLDPNTTFEQAWTSRDELLRILGEKHRLYDFLRTLSMKCSYLLFNKEYVKEILLESSEQKSAENTQFIQSCMNLLVIIARFSPLLLSGVEEELVNLLKEDNEIVKEGVLHVLARAGGTIRQQLAMTSSSVDLILERLCLEGNRVQAKYAVHALAAITKDDGLKSLSVLYKRLVDMLEEKTHLPAILQSLGCIAQTAMPVFETRESEIIEFIRNKIFECSNKAEKSNQACWDDRSELCSLKIFGIKTLVKSYLPVKDAHLRLGIENLLGILKNFLTFGEISEDIESSPVDKAHLKLASAKAVLRLSRHWDHKIPINVFHLTLTTSEAIYPQVKKLFHGKVHQYIKDRLLDAKYACAFLLNLTGYQEPDSKEDKHNLDEVIQMCHQARARQLSMQCDSNPLLAYPECILPYLVHVLAHHPSFPNIDECTDVKAFEPIYRQLYLFLSTLVHEDKSGKSDANTSKEKETVSTIISIFHSIKSSEDIVDMVKSKNSHAICDIGMSITKRLAQQQDGLKELTSSVPLPTSLYKSVENKEGVDSLTSEKQMWLYGDSVLAHLESIELETDAMVPSENPEDDNVLKASDRDEIEVPLGKMIKRLKSQRAKTKKIAKNKALTAERKNQDNDVDILGMVREINLDNLERSKDLESGNGHRYFVSGGKENDATVSDKIPEQQKRKRGKTGDSISMAIPKRRRSLSAHDAHKSSRLSSSMDLKKTSGNNSNHTKLSSEKSIELYEETNTGSEDKMSTKKKMIKTTKSDLLASCLPMKSIGKITGQKLKETSHIVGRTEIHALKRSSVLKTDKANSIANSEASTGNIKKRKRRSIAGLAKCSLKESGDHGANLIGKRIKVWWPLDKQFYEGVVQSYDQGKKKHVILYDDGDMEVLLLKKERWELINKGYQPRKHLKLPNVSPSKEISSEKKRNRAPGQSRQNKKSTKKSSSSRNRRKITGKRNVEQENSVVLESKVDADFSEENQVERLETNQTDEEESDKEQKPVAEGVVEDAEECPVDAQESDKEEKSDSEGTAMKSQLDAEESSKEISDSEGGKQIERTDRSQTDTEESSKEGKSDSEGKQADEGEKSSINQKESDKEEKSDASSSKDMGDSDNEPLSMWRRRAGKEV
ncbi:PREDICTED: sister chromatid cohesion protein PDS5 homolog A-like isoform X2 [Nelumbo nucifera]|uniref:Sister chromatid cohesion protein PDS5 homolog A-like isoform X2 n=2 Tax=Nelumbo nucifera TaxID=4432 RepID=A0A1U7Z9Y0_NELNU|nr:PREDICTED: sister chromatid cohesion protein PDS5 homolog A-like isoform X2 [Nelumbo nucifera]